MSKCYDFGHSHKITRPRRSHGQDIATDGHSHKITRPRRSHGQDIATDGHSHTDKHNPLSYQNTTTPHRYHNDSIPLFHSHSLHSPQPLLAQSTVTPYSSVTPSTVAQPNYTRQLNPGHYYFTISPCRSLVYK